jgi:hypothetical protein
MAKSFLWLIIVWSVICASGLGIYLYQFFDPIIPSPGRNTGDLALPVTFWVIAWLLPSLIMALAGRKRGD